MVNVRDAGRRASTGSRIHCLVLTQSLRLNCPDYQSRPVFLTVRKKFFFQSFFLLFVSGNFLTFRGGCLPKKFGVACQKFQLLLMLFVSRVRDVTSMQTNLTTDLNREEPRTGGQDCVTIYCDTISGDNVDFLDGK